MYIPQPVDFSKVVQGAKDQQAKLQAEAQKKRTAGKANENLVNCRSCCRRTIFVHEKIN